MIKRLGLRGAALVAFLLAVPAMVAAQGYPPPPPGGGPGGGPPAAGPAGAGGQRDARGFWQRRGIYGGVGLGFGEMTADCDGCGDALESVAFHFDIGFKLNTQLGLFLDGWGLGHPEETPLGNVTLVQAIATVGVQFWVAPQLWVKGGLGSAQLSIQYEDGYEDTSETVAGVMVAGGYELLSSPNFSLDAELRGGTGFFENGNVNNVSVSLGIHWHSLWHGGVIIVN